MSYNGETHISAREGTAYIRQGNQNILLFETKKVEAKIKKNKQEFYVMGTRMASHKTTGASGSGTLSIREVRSDFKETLREYIRTGRDLYFDLMVTNNDPGTPYGSETKLLTGCNFDEMTIALLDMEGNLLEQDIPFTFEGFEILEAYKSV